MATAWLEYGDPDAGDFGAIDVSCIARVECKPITTSRWAVRAFASDNTVLLFTEFNDAQTARFSANMIIQKLKEFEAYLQELQLPKKEDA